MSTTLRSLQCNGKNLLVTTHTVQITEKLTENQTQAKQREILSGIHGD